MTDLAERIDAATGPDRELDCLIEASRRKDARVIYTKGHRMFLHPGEGRIALCVSGGRGTKWGIVYQHRAYTASIDAAARLFDNDAWLMIALNNASRFCESRDQIPRHLAAAAIRAGGK